MKYDAFNKPVIGIDLGTTFSCIARWTGKEAEIYTPKGENVFQSVVYYDDTNNKYVYGRTAFLAGVLKPENVCIGVKRLMDDRNAVIQIGSVSLSPIEVSALILEHLYSNVAGMFPSGVFKASGVVVTVPYYFKAHQCENTSEAAKKAGLELLGILQEPIAAAFAYGLHHSYSDTVREETIMVFDLGGGTFDITVFTIKETKSAITFEVICTGGDDRLGGMDFDQAFMDYIIKKEGFDLDKVDNERLRKRSKQRLLEEVIKAKETLSSTDKTYIGIAEIAPGVNIDSDYTRSEFEEVLEPYLERISEIIKSTMACADINKGKIDKVIKVGGSSKIPIMSHIIDRVVGAGKVYANIDPSLCVAQGAAIYAAYLSKNMEMGKKFEVIPATAHSLGVEDSNGKFITIIHANQKTPAKKMQQFLTTEDYCTSIDIKVYQGASKIAKQNTHVGTVVVDNIKPAPAGQIQINITFEVGHEQNVTVTIEQPESNIKKTEVLRLM